MIKSVIYFIYLFIFQKHDNRKNIENLKSLNIYDQLDTIGYDTTSQNPRRDNSILNTAKKSSSKIVPFALSIYLSALAISFHFLLSFLVTNIVLNSVRSASNSIPFQLYILVR